MLSWFLVLGFALLSLQVITNSQLDWLGVPGAVAYIFGTRIERMFGCVLDVNAIAVKSSRLEILATWSSAIGKTMKYNVMIGTSMACPHVIGIVAFIKVVHPSSSPSVVNSAI
nr:subtilisin-like protease SBT3.9 [Tanacetum cinerariifolium]